MKKRLSKLAPIDIEGFSLILNDAALEMALKCARGCYQRNVLRGIEALSGSTLKGKAARYKGRYMGSIRNLLDRCRAMGVEVGEVRGSKGKRILTIG